MDKFDFDDMYDSMPLPRATEQELARFNAYQEEEEKYRGLDFEKESKAFNLQNELIYNYDWSDEVFEENGKFGVRNFLGKVIIFPEWDDIPCPLDYFANDKVPYIVSKDGLCGLVMAGDDNRIISDCIYDFITPEGERNIYSPNICEYFIVSKDKLYGILNIDGTEKVPCIMDSIEEGLHLYKDGKVGFVASNLDGNVVWPEFDEIDFESDELMPSARKNGQWGRVNLSSGFFETDGEDLPVTIHETISVGDLVLDVCTAEGFEEILFKLNTSLLAHLKTKKANGVNLTDYVNKLINAEAHTSLSKVPVPLRGHIIASTKDLADKRNLPVTNPDIKGSLEEWLDDLAISDCFDNLFNEDAVSGEAVSEFNPEDFFGPSNDDEADIIFSAGSYKAKIINGKWRFSNLFGEFDGEYDEFRGRYPTRLRVRSGEVWKDLESGIYGQSSDESYAMASPRICRCLDAILGNNDGHYVAKDILAICKEKGFTTEDVEYPEESYDILETRVTDGLTIHKVAVPYLADTEYGQDYAFMLDKPLIEVIRERRSTEFNGPSLIQEAFGTGPDESLLPYQADRILFYNMKIQKNQEGLAETLTELLINNYILADFVFEKDGKKGVMDPYGYTVIEPLYDDADPTCSDNNFYRGAIVTLNGKKSYAFRCSRSPLESEWYDDIKYYFCSSMTYVVKKDEKFGLINVYGDVIVPCEMDFIGNPEQGSTLVKQGNLWGFILDTQDRFIGVDGIVFIEPQYADWRGHKRFMVMKQDGEWGYLDEYGDFTSSEDESKTFWPVLSPTHCFCDTIGNSTRVTDVYEELQVTDGELIPAGEGPSAIIEKYEEALEEFSSEQIGKALTLEKQLRKFRDHIDWSNIPFESDGHWGLKNTEGKILIPPIYDEIRKNSTAKWAAMIPVSARRGNKWGLVSQFDDGEKELTPFEYDKITYHGIFNGFECKKGDESIYYSAHGILMGDEHQPFVMNDLK